MDNRFKLVSLGDIVETFEANAILDAGNNLSVFRAPVLWQKPRKLPEDLDQVLSEPNHKIAARHLREICNLCQALGLQMTVKKLERVIDSVEKESLTWRAMASSSEDVYERLADELKTHVFLAISPKHVPYYEEFAETWDNVITKFPTVAYDVEEACKCLSLDRHTACVYHVMRIGEAGLTEVARFIGYQAARPGWEDVLGYMDKQLKHNREDMEAAFKGDVEFLSGVAAHMRNVKIAWRNRVSHIESKYTEEEAERIYVSTKVFMEHIAAKMSGLDES